MVNQHIRLSRSIEPQVEAGKLVTCQQSGMIHLIVDGETNFTPIASSVSGYYDIRIMVNDTDGASTGWSTYSDVIQVITNQPTITDYSIEDSTLLRNQNTRIFVNVDDVEDSDSSLSLTAQHKSPSGSWSDSYFGTPWFNSTSNYWEANFTATASAELGQYDIRVRVTDLDGDNSNWSIYSDNVTISNNNPVLQNYQLSSSSLLRINTIVVE